MTKIRSTLSTAAWYIFLLALVIFSLYVTFINPQMMVDFVLWVEKTVQYLGYWNYIILVIVAILESIPFVSIIIPGVKVTAAIFGGLGRNGFIPALISVVGGSIIGYILTYIRGKNIPSSTLYNLAEKMGLDQKSLDALIEKVRLHPFATLFMSQIHGVIRSFVGIIAGVVRLRSHAGILVGGIVWTAMRGIIGIQFIQHIDKISKYIGIIMLVIIAIGVYREWKKQHNS